MCLDILLGGVDRHVGYGGCDSLRIKHRPLHFLSAPSGASTLLYRRDLAGGWLMGLVLGNDSLVSCLAKRTSSEADTAACAWNPGVGDRVDTGDGGTRSRGIGHADSLVFGLGGEDRSRLGSNLFLVVRPPTGLFLAPPCLCPLVHGSACSGGRKALQRFLGPYGVCSFHSLLHSGGFPPPVHGPRNLGRLEARPYREHVCYPLSKLRYPPLPSLLPWRSRDA